MQIFLMFYNVWQNQAARAELTASVILLCGRAGRVACAAAHSRKAYFPATEYRYSVMAIATARIAPMQKRYTPAPSISRKAFCFHELAP